MGETTNPDTCAHTWEETGIVSAASGRRWQQVSECFFCPLCGSFSRRIRWFLDGDFYKTQREADRANAENADRYAAEKAAWLAARHPHRQPA